MVVVIVADEDGVNVGQLRNGAWRFLKSFGSEKLNRGGSI